MRFIRYQAYAIGCLCAVLQLYGQENRRFHATLFDSENGMPVSYFSCVQRDAKGYLWAGSNKGLIQHNGYDYTLWSRDIDNANSLPSNEVNDIFIDPSGYLWMVHAEGGVSCFDPSRKKFTRYEVILNGKPAYVSGIRPAQKEGLMLLSSSSGLIQLQINSGSVTRIPGGTAVKDVLIEADGGMFAACKEGLMYCPPGKDSLEVLTTITVPDAQRSGSYFSGIIRLPNDKLLLSTIDFGIMLYDPLDQLITPVFPNSQLISIQKRKILSLYLQKDQQAVWIGASDSLFRYDLATGRTQYCLQFDERLAGVSSGGAVQFHEDNEGLLWVATRQGLLRVRLNSQAFRVYPLPGAITEAKSISACFEDSRGRMWLGYANMGLFVQNPLTGAFRPVDDHTTQTRLSKVSPGVVLEGKSGVFWVGTQSGLFEVTEKAGNGFDIRYHRNPDNWGNYIISLLPNGDSALFVGSLDGLYSFSFRTKRFRLLPNGNLKSNSGLCMAGKSAGYLWYGTRKGLGRLNLKTQQWQAYHSSDSSARGLRDDMILHLHQDAASRLWVGTSNGLHLYLPQRDSFVVFDEKAGLPNTYINHIYSNGPNELWIATVKGICRMKFDHSAEIPRLTSLRTYTKADGLAANHYYFGTSCQRKDKSIFIASAAGLIWFDPSAIKDRIPPALTSITAFKVLNEDADIETLPAFLKQIRLKHHENLVSFEFSALNFSAPENIQYAYMLEGFDPDWVMCGKRRFAHYTNLPHGSYRFKVKATNSEGVWNEIPAEMELIILPAYWQTWWFRLLLTGAAAALLFFLLLSRKRQREARHQKEIAEQSARHKAEFLANMSHEIRTPMNAVVGSTHLLLHTPLSEQQAKYVQNIRKSADNLLVIINDILDFSKIEAGKLNFVSKPFRTREVFDYVENALLPQLRENNNRLSLVIEAGTPEHLRGDSNRLIQIMLNLGSNATKFTKNGRIDIRVYARATQLESTFLHVDIEDSGIGIPPDKLERIFESFEQASDDISDQYGGTGLGLAIVKRLVTDQGGAIKVSSVAGQGSLFSFHIPYQIMPEPEQEAETQAGPSVVSQPARILLVEDNELNREIATELIQEQLPQARIEWAENGAVAVERLREAFAFDLVLMDVKMPVMDGLEATRCIREQLAPPVNRIPVIALTASATDEEVRRCIEAGMNDFVSKPFDPEQLGKKIRQLLREQPEAPATVLSEKQEPGLKVDHALLLRMLGNNTGLTERFIQNFKHSAADAPAKMRLSLEAGDRDAMSIEAHTLKTHAAYLGIEELRAHADKMEREIAQVSTDTALLWVEALENMLARVEF